jgi:acetyl-CoA acetyltransferase
MYLTQGLRRAVQQVPNVTASVYKNRHRTFAKIRAKASRHAANNPLALFRHVVTGEKVLAAPVMWPVVDGDNTYGGQVVTNPSGGLLSKGHPLGATGLAQCTELVTARRGWRAAGVGRAAGAATQPGLGRCLRGDAV